MSEGASLLVPFLDPSQRYCRGVEYGMMVVTHMLDGRPEVKGYFRSLNEEQIRLTCYRLGYEVSEVAPWRHEGRRTGWVWMVLSRRPDLTDGAGI